VKKHKLLRFVEFVNKYVGENYASVAQHFDSEISKMAQDCRVDWSKTKQNLKYDGEKDNSKNIITLESSDNRRTYVSGINKTFEKDGATFEYPIIIFACMQNSYGCPSAKFNALGLLFDAYDKYKSSRIIPTPSKKITRDELQKQEKIQTDKNAQYQRWVEGQKAKEPKLFSNMLPLKAPKAFSTYLQSKKVETIAKGFNIRVGKDDNGYFTCFELMNIQGEIGGLQRIYHRKPEAWESNKKQTVGFDPMGSFLVLGSLSSKTEMVYICEGLATGLSMHQATGRTILVCLMAHNIEPVSREILKTLPNVKRVHVADNDNSTLHCGNTGIYQCSLSVKKNGGFVFIPKPSKGNDANDVHVYDGIEALKSQIHDNSNYFNGRFSKDVEAVFNLLQ
jgi:phage/plasmid primase-like uncharacterized protein